MLSRDVNAATRLVEASWRHDNTLKTSNLSDKMLKKICRQETNGRLYFKRYDF